MTEADQIKILGTKNIQNKAQYNLDWKVVKIYAYSSNDLNKYEYLAGEDLALQPSTVEEARFEYSPLGKIFNKGLKEEDKKEGLLKRLRNIEDKNEDKLKAKEVTYFVEELLSLEGKVLIEEIKITQKDVDYRKLKVTGGNKITYDFSDYELFKELFRCLYYKNMTIDETEKNKINLMDYLVL